MVAQVFGGAPAVGEAIVSVIAAIGHCQDKAAPLLHWVVLVFGWQLWHLTGGRCVAIGSMLTHQQLFRVDVDLDTARVEATFHALGLGGLNVGVATQAKGHVRGHQQH